jgi:hypothetical protein
LGVVNAEIGSNEKAAEYFELALQIYAQYLVDNGLENITSSDASFVQTLFSNARALNNPALLQKIIDQLNAYTNVLGGRTKEYSTAFGRLITSYRFQVEDTIDVFINDRSDENKKTALDAIERFTLTVRETGYQTVRRGDNEGQKYYRLAPLYNVNAVAYFLVLGEIEKAKDQLAYTFSYYGAADYDADYSLPAQNYAAITALEYTFPLIDVAFTSELIYDFEDNIALSIAASDSFFIDDIESGVKDAKAAKNNKNAVATL